MRSLSALGGLPVLAVLGNHDYECGAVEEVTHLLSSNGVRILDGTSVEIDGVGFVGVKGFAGGFGERALQPWGEAVLKQFVREGVEEALKLESGLAQLRVPTRISCCIIPRSRRRLKGSRWRSFPSSDRVDWKSP